MSSTILLLVLACLILPHFTMFYRLSWSSHSTIQMFVRPTSSVRAFGGTWVHRYLSCSGRYLCPEFEEQLERFRSTNFPISKTEFNSKKP
ncbi:hypothetical protein BDY19DRAFT_709901 [Irpex rosettiformis]|uniref:Uncharacterized protein n=1 Tax=Irpex rosettiformis TaxID=378272 RepID=A0ACB8TMN7_9APHY|nr:hypothetical protein BDY19DRAFT_709901 [Irpex rosettiformis]